MNRTDIGVMRDEHDIVGYLHRCVVELLSSPQASMECGVNHKAFLWTKEHPEHKRLPRSLVRGVFRFGRGVTDGIDSFKAKGCKLKVRGLGEVELSEPMRGKPFRYEIVDAEHIATYGMHRPPRATAPEKTTAPSSINALRREDSTLDFVVVNEGYNGDTTWRRARALEYVAAHPDLTRKELYDLGFRSQRDMDLLADYQQGMQEWLRSVSKPQECDILSNGQFKVRWKNEFSMPDAITQSDASFGSTKNQSYAAQVYRAMHSSVTEFMF